MTSHDLIEAFNTIAEAPDGVARLRALVLQLAVCGRLIPQDPADERAEVLLELIATERAKLVMAGSIRKPRPRQRLSQAELPFEVPEPWVWTRLGDLVVKLVDGSHNPPRDVGPAGAPMLSGQNVRTGTITLDASRFISQSDLATERKRVDPSPGDLLLCIVGSIGRAAVVPPNFPMVAL